MKALDLLATEENIYTTLIDDAIGRTYGSDEPPWLSDTGSPFIANPIINPFWKFEEYAILSPHWIKYNIYFIKSQGFDSCFIII